MTLATGAAAATGGSSFTLLILALPILFLLFLMFGQRRRARAMSQAQQALAPGQEVMTTAGMYGVVAAVEGEVVHLQVADGVVLRHQRRAILPLDLVQGAPGGRAATGQTPDETTDEDPQR